MSCARSFWYSEPSASSFCTTISRGILQRTTVSKSERCIIVLASPSTSTAGLLPFAIVAPMAVGSIWPMHPKKPDACT